MAILFLSISYLCFPWHRLHIIVFIASLRSSCSLDRNSFTDRLSSFSAIRFLREERLCKSEGIEQGIKGDRSIGLLRPGPPRKTSNLSSLHLREPPPTSPGTSAIEDYSFIPPDNFPSPTYISYSFRLSGLLTMSQAARKTLKASSARG